ncbi:DMT family transporter [Desmospora profundinema]|uniref:Drug/metabolite transporter (DMT)-like permease n=1 Tax=Desmospora profundinema TaxID=1571184 RepID=A0ABU1IPM0_9BACL|nr:DMT family transporter [Desmospora profundinema]MDR6225700.1 drug/metabolite transporter (DMT)-like permease [Desmospora profundinema]
MKNGVVLAILSSLVFSVMNALVKAVSLSIPTAEIVFFRSLIGTMMIYFMMRYSNVTFSSQGVPLLVLRGVFGALYLLAYFYTIAKIPLADASILAHLSPVFVIILSVVLLKEKMTKQTILLVSLVFLGVVLLVKPFHFSTYSIYALIGVLSALFAAGAAITVRYLSDKHHTYEIVFYFLATGTMVSIPLMWNTFVVPTPLESFYLVCIGVVSLLGQVFLTQAFTHENAAVVSVARYIGIVFNALWGFVFWAEVPDIVTILGGICIISACVALSWKKQRPQMEKAKLAKS